MSGPADRDAWLAARLRAVGGSEVAALFDCQPDYALSRYALWHVKAGNAPAPEVDNERVRWGLRLEDAIAHGVAEDNGWSIEKGGHVIDPVTPGMACTLDFIVRKPDRTDPGALEIKNADWLVHRRTWTDGEPPLHIGLQLQHQLACTGYQWGIVAALVGGNRPMLYPYEAKPALIAEIRSRVAAFWQSIADGREPPVDGSDGAAAVIRAMYPDVADETVDLTADNEAPDICARLLRAATVRKEAEAEEAKCKNVLLAKAGEHKCVLFQGYQVSLVVKADAPDRIAMPGEVIRGRRGSRYPNVKELA